MSQRQRFFSRSAIAVAVAMAAGATAPAIAAEGAAMIEEVTVTGSRIPRAGFDTMLPATVLDSEFIEARAFTNPADALNQLPSFGLPGNSTEGNQDSASVGQNFVNFFGLGSQRTLTLVNGRRFVSSNAPTLLSGAAPGLQVDLNVIPTSMIERIETVAVGGAPVYGADAIAGTVNVILKDDFEGLQIGGTWGSATEDNDLEEENFEILWGTNFDGGRGNIVVAYEHNNREGLIENQRPHLNEGWQFREPVNGTSEFARILVPNARANIVAPGGVVTPGPVLQPFRDTGALGTDANGTPIYRAFGPDGSLQPYDVGQATGNSVWSIGGEGIFLPDLTSLYTPLDRDIVTAFTTYDVTDRVEIYGEFFFANNNSQELVNQPAYQSGFFGQESRPLLFSTDHPLLSPTARNQIENEFGLNEFYLQRASVDLGDRRVDNELNMWRVVAGMRGDFDIGDRTLNWDMSWNRGQSDANSRQTDIVSDRFFYAMDVVDVGNGPQCRVVAEPTSRPTDPAVAFGASQKDNEFTECVPLDLFGAGRPSADVIDYLTADYVSNTEIVQEVYELNANMDVIDLPAGPATVAAGFMHRQESGRFDAGGFLALGLSRNQPVNGITGGYETDEYYAEAFVPIVSESMDIPFVENFSIEGAFRTVDNSLAGSDDIWTIGGRLSPVADVEFRGNVTRSVRAPALTELFLPLSGTGSFAADPCDNRNVDSGQTPATRRANCVAEGIDPDTFVSSVQNASVQGFTGGNLNLENEVADAWTVGVVLRPRWVEDLTVAIDWVDIEIEEAIENFTLTQIMQSCYDSPAFPNSFCGQFNRQPDGQLPPINAFTSGYVNAGVRSFEALTVDADWTTPLAEWPMMGSFENPGMLNVGAYMFFPQESVTNIQGAIDDSLGEPDTAEEQIQLNLTYVRDNLSVFWQTRYIGEATIDNDDAPLDRNVLELKATFLFNAGVRYRFNENVMASLNVDNVFDNQPQAAAIASGWDNVYDNRGRFLRAGIQINL